jgi:quinohemoprotein ethanol dehydrogenase
VDSTRIENSDGEAANWLSYGRTYDEQRFSPLKQINADNAKNLGLAWFADLDTNRGQEATPLFVDGVVYISIAWSMVKAYDGSTGKLLWSYDPGVPRELGVNACCHVVNRGVAPGTGRSLWPRSMVGSSRSTPQPESRSGPRSLSTPTSPTRLRRPLVLSRAA